MQWPSRSEIVDQKLQLQSCSEITAANETAIATLAPLNDLIFPNTALIDPATSHAPIQHQDFQRFHVSW